MVDAEEELNSALADVLLDKVDGLDADLVAYIAGMLASKVAEETDSIVAAVEEVLFPFLESVQCPDDLVKNAEEKVLEVLHATKHGNNEPSQPVRKLQQGVVSMSLQQSEQEQEASRYLWGTEGGIKAMANELIDAHTDKSSARDKRKARKLEAEKARKLLSSAYDKDTDQDETGLVRMNVRAFNANQGTDKKRDVLVKNVTVSLNNGTVLLESGELKFAYQRRYGLIGENGVGKIACIHDTTAFIKGKTSHAFSFL
jgi:ATP-binding cassette subfamily F protein 3